MTKFAKSITLAALTATVIGMSVLSSTTATQAEPLGSTCSDCAAYRGEYSIENHSGAPLVYQFRWGDNEPWRPVILANDTIRTHTYPLGDDPRAAIPTPSVRFAGHICLGGVCGAEDAWRTSEMDFYAVRVDPGFTSPGTVIKRGSPRRYMFWVMRDGSGGFRVHLLRK
jgi:hypothetical protein